MIPGYGFLSEKPDFARACKDAGIGWVGPNADVIEKFGIKHVARELAEKSGVPIVPGTKGLVKDADEAVKESGKIGYPVSNNYLTRMIGNLRSPLKRRRNS